MKNKLNIIEILQWVAILGLILIEGQIAYLLFQIAIKN